MLLSRTQIAKLSKLYKNGEEANAIEFDDKRKIWERVTLEESVGLAYCLNITFVPFIGTIKPASLEDLIKACNLVFESFQIADNVIIEGVVIRSMGETKYSRKMLNPEYDSKK